MKGFYLAIVLAICTGCGTAPVVSPTQEFADLPSPPTIDLAGVGLEAESAAEKNTRAPDAAALAVGPERTASGFFYPTGTSVLGPYAGWLASGCNGASGYEPGLYHLGKDIQATVGTSTLSIADGEVIAVSQNGWGSGNLGVAIRHSLTDGRQIVSVSGHVQTAVTAGTRLQAGQPFATVGQYSPSHLHCGIRIGRAIPPTPWGKEPCSAWPATNAFVEPISAITQLSPANGLMGRSIDDAHSRAGQDARFQGVKPGTFGSNLNWDANWELRWLDFGFSLGRTVRIWGATYKFDSRYRYTTFFDVDAGAWTAWVRASP